MSKFLKFIVGIVLAVFIISGAALLIPSYLGYNTTIVDSATTGNQKTGTVIYTEQKAVSKLADGDKILELRGDSVNVRTVKSYDQDAETVAYEDGTEGTLPASGDYYLVKMAVPVLGYLSIAMQSRNGLIFLGLILLLVIVLFILSEVLRHHAEAMDDYDAYDEEDDDEYFENLAVTHQLNLEKSKAAADAKKKEQEDGKEKKDKKDKKEKDRRENESEKDRKERRSEGRKHRDKRDRKREADDQDEMLNRPEDAEDDGYFERKPVSEDVSPEDLEEALKDTEGSDAIQNPEALNQTDPDADYKERKSAEENAVGNDEDRDEVQIAMPARTAEELLQKAYQDGLDPKVHEDEITGVTLIDYSDSL